MGKAYTFTFSVRQCKPFSANESLLLLPLGREAG
jgi:hypothetical protein